MAGGGGWQDEGAFACERLPMRLLLLALLVPGLLGAPPAVAQVRVKDLATLSDTGGGEAAFVSHGMVTGLPGTGDSPMVPRGMLPPGVRMGRDVAQVMVTVRLAPGMRAGTRVDASVAAIGDARSLAGGVLAPVAFEGGDRRIYATASGPVAAGGIDVTAPGARLTRGTPTAGMVPGGAVVETDVPGGVGANGEVLFVLRQPDFTTAARLARAIDAELGQPLARAVDKGAVAVRVPDSFPEGLVGLIARAENARLTPDRAPARIVVDARTGSIVSGLDVPLAPVAIGHGPLQIRVSETPVVSQPPPFSSGGRTLVVPRSTIEVSEGNRVIATPSGGTVGDLLRSLSAAGVSTLDQIAILQSLKAAGGIDADLVSR